MIQEQNTLPADSIPTAPPGLKALEDMSFQDAVSYLAHNLVEFAFHLAIAVVVFYAGRFIINKLFKLTARLLLRRRVDVSLSTFILSLVRILLYFILIVTVIGILGINTTSFLALFASAGVAVGMALSGTLQNFAGGVLILLLKPYKVGDYIEAQGFAGTVREIQIFHTLLLTPDNKSIIIPNGGLSTGSINNFSKQPLRRVTWSVALAYGDDFETARAAILEMLRADDRVINGIAEVEADQSPLMCDGDLPDRSPNVVLDELGDSSINLSVRAWVPSGQFWDVYYHFNALFYKRLPELGFHFPFPQLDVHLDGALTPKEP